METLTVFGELLSLEFMQSYSRQRQHQLGPDLLEGHIYVRSLGFYPNQKDQGKPPPPRPWITKKSSTLWRKSRLLAQSWRNLLLTINNRSIANCVLWPRLLCMRAARFTSPHLTQISRGSLNAFSPFLSSRIKCGPSLKRWAWAMTISGALKHQRLKRSPSCLTLTVCRFSLPLRGPHFVSTFHALTPHIKWAGDPGGNGFDIS